MAFDNQVSKHSEDSSVGFAEVQVKINIGNIGISLRTQAVYFLDQSLLPPKAYVLADTTLAGYRKHQKNCSREEIAAACAHTAVFQTLASLALPAVAWHKRHSGERQLEAEGHSSFARVVEWCGRVGVVDDDEDEAVISSKLSA